MKKIIVTLDKKFQVPLFEYIYMFIMVIYMGQMTFETSRMNYSLSGNPIPFLIPIIATIILLKRRKVSFYDKKLFKLLCIFIIWSLLQSIKNQLFNSQELSYYFFLFYSLLIAYIHIKVFDKKIFILYEDIIVRLSILGLIIWITAVILPSPLQSFFRMFPDTGYGHNFLYLYNLMDPEQGQVSILLRNAGFSWEPGRYAICLLPAIWFNLSVNDIKFKKNRKIIVLLTAMLSTQSTTGICITILLYSIYYLKTISIKSIFATTILMLPIIYLSLQTDFIGGKISRQLDISSQKEEIEKNIAWHKKQSNHNELIASMDRFISAYYELTNIQHAPFIGYGLNTDHSFFYQKITSNYNLTGGFLQLLGMFGIILGTYIYYLLFKSSIILNQRKVDLRKYSIFFIIILSSISYPIFGLPLFTAFWLYGYFYNK